MSLRKKIILFCLIGIFSLIFSFLLTNVNFVQAFIISRRRPPAPTCSISASPTIIQSGRSLTLSWSSTNATTCSILGIGSVRTSGSRSVSPTSTTTYTLTCDGRGGRCSASATVRVTTPPPPVRPASPAVTKPASPGTIYIQNPLRAKSFEELINAIINFIFWVAVALAPLLIIIAGFYFLTAAGNPAKIQIAKNIILYTCIGLFIILFAKGLIAVIQSVLGVK